MLMMNRMNPTKKAGGVMKHTLALVLCLGLWACTDQTGTQWQQKYEALNAEYQTLKAEHAALAAKIEPKAVEGDALMAEIIAEQRARYSAVAAALKTQPEVIPLAAELGGTMRFTEVQPLNNEWVYAAYEDGHVAGSALFAYRLAASGDKVEFKVLNQLVE